MTSGKNEAIAAHRRGDLASAERLYRDSLHTSPSDPELQHYLGLLCHQTGRSSEAAEMLRAALKVAPGSVPTLQLLIRVCDESGDAQGALDALNRYFALRPNDAGMLNVRGQQFVRLGRLREAEHDFRQAAEKTGNAASFHDLGLCRRLQGNLSGAAGAFAEAVRRGHGQPQTRLWLAQCLRATGRIREYYDAAMDAARSVPGGIDLLLEAQSARRYVCDWDGFERNQPELLTGLSHALQAGGAHDIPPGILNFLEVDEETISQVAKRYARQLSIAGVELRRKLRNPVTPREHEKIRLGYLSTDFFAHAVGYLVRDLFACHDHMRFEVYGYSLRHQPDEVQQRIEQGCDVYRNLSGKDADVIAQTILDDGIDILIDLAGYTSAAQPLVLAARPAPIQVSWLGYLGTSGSEFIDYIVADDVVLPPDVAQYYTERSIRLPFFLVASPLPVAERRPSRIEAGLGDTGFVFCSFNQPYKLDRSAFSAWMEILGRVPDSKLWLYVSDMDVCAGNLRHEAGRLNVNPDRLVFAGREPMANHVARMSLANLALDPFHISGGATSIAAVAAGLPVLTYRGNSFLARMGSSINAYLGMEDLDCMNQDEYVAKAVELATDASRLAMTRNKLDLALKSRAFFDPHNCVRSLEDAIGITWDRHKKGLTRADIVETGSLVPDSRRS